MAGCRPVGLACTHRQACVTFLFHVLDDISYIGFKLAYLALKNANLFCAQAATRCLMLHRIVYILRVHYRCMRDRCSTGVLQMYVAMYTSLPATLLSSCVCVTHAPSFRHDPTSVHPWACSPCKLCLPQSTFHLSWLQNDISAFWTKAKMGKDAFTVPSNRRARASSSVVT